MLDELDDFNSVRKFLSQLKIFFDNENQLFVSQTDNNQKVSAFFHNGYLVLNLRNSETAEQCVLVKDNPEDRFTFIDYKNKDVQFNYNHIQNEFALNIRNSRNKIIVNKNSLDFLTPKNKKLNNILKFGEFSKYLTKDSLLFLEDVTVENKDIYYRLLQNNKNNLHNFIELYQDAKSLDINFFNMSKNDKELLKLKTDISVDIFDMSRCITKELDAGVIKRSILNALRKYK